MMEAVAVQAIDVQRGRLTARISCAPHARYTTHGLARQVVRRFPQLPTHTCVNAAGPNFGTVMAHTSVPHLVEHLVIQLQVAAEPPDSLARFTGTTQWVCEGDGLAEVAVNFRDDRTALAALRDALRTVNELLQQPDAGRERGECYECGAPANATSQT